MDNVPIITVTGTKGKTTTVAVIADVLRTLNKNVLKVDTTGHFVNGERRSTLDESKAAWRLVPSVCPGRYLYEFALHPELRTDGVAVLESSLGSSAASGLGYRHHNVGVFLNVFEDHIGSSDRIRNKQDIVSAKQFVFERLDPNDGFAVFNADDEYVCSGLEALPKAIKGDPTKLLPVGLEFSHYDMTAHLEAGGAVLTVTDDQEIVVRTHSGDTVLADLHQIPWAFSGSFAPSVWNLLSAAGALYGYFRGVLPDGLRDALEGVRLDRYGGRLTLMRASTGVTILVDYAHEKESLASVASLGRSLVKGGGRLIGVVRMAHDRTDELKIETGEVIGRSFDEVVVYEKIDGYWRKPVEKAHMRFPQVVGETSALVEKGAASVNANVVRILREDEALQHTATLAAPEDVVVVIVNDNIERSIKFIQEAFYAEFI